MRIKNKQFWFNILLAVVLIAYPFLVYFGLNYFSLKYLGIVLAAVFIVRLVFVANQKWISLAGISLSLFAVIFSDPIFFKLTPVVINLILFAVFFSSLFADKTVVAKIAERKRELTPEVIKYTSRVTQVWSGFFILNAAIAAYTVYYTTQETWTLYNGLLSYLLVGMLFGGEYIFRQYWIKA